MIEIKSYDEPNAISYDCIECGQKECVTVIGNIGFCKTIGCLENDPIQLIHFPNWTKPKASIANRDIWWIK